MVEERPPKPTLLHGVLQLTLHSAQNLPATRLIHGVFKKQTTDPYVTVLIGDNRLIKSSVVDNNRNPIWDEEFRVHVCCADVQIVLQVVDKDVKTGETLGKVRIKCKELVQETVVSGWQTLVDDTGEVLHSYVKFNMSYVACSDLPTDLEVHDNYFPVRKLGNLTLYQDAHSTSEHFGHTPGNCFEDIYNNIFTAKKFIYISGRVNPYLQLLRGHKRCLSLGKLLIRKAKSGVNVLLLIWHEDAKLQKVPDLNDTRQSSQAVKEYFHSTGVKVCLVKRTKAKLGYLKEQVADTCYDHNQRCIILDAPDYTPSSSKRCIVAYLGGLDLATGYWDTPDHELYTSLEEEHEGDFYQPSCVTTSQIGPRLPQHSVHSKVEGRGAYDVLKNFEERWRGQALPSKLSALSKINSNKYILRGGSAKHNGWSVQLFRSINEDSCEFNKANNLKLDKGRLIDEGIHKALIHHIRRTQKFLYIETEQFMGRSWKGNQPKGHHLIALEIVSKICASIFSRRRFAVYIVLPIHPPGDPASPQIQEMIFWQTQTMDMMYRMVSKALAKKGEEGARVTDYLNFYTLGSRVYNQLGPQLTEGQTDVPSNALHRRGFVNISGCLLIADDEYILLGAGAISQRSLSGKRNTELAVGAWQPKHTQENLEDKPHPKGKVHHFRLALWAEHTGLSNPTFRRPHRIGCVRDMNRIANENWKLYVSPDSNSCTNSSLLKYPIAIQRSGQVGHRKDALFIPDTKAKTVGRRQRFPSEKLTS